MGAGPRDRKTTVKERSNPTHPVQPLNFNVLYGFSADLNAFDLYWDDPGILCGNAAFNVLGVNIYRAYDSELGPYERLNAVPLGATFYRDETLNDLVVEEDVTNAFLASGDLDDESGRYIFRTQNYPIVKPESEAVPAEYPTDVTVVIDGVEVVPLRVFGNTGEIELRTDQFYDVATNALIDPILPRPDSVVTCTYRYNTNLVENQLGRKMFYRITTVATRDEWDGELRETPLEWTDAKSVDHIENLDYIWREAIRRNSWILDQGGERVKVFIRKWNGEKCVQCVDDEYNQARNDCHTCFPPGTLVRAERGYVPIEDIQIGERVLTHDGTYQEVLATMETPFSGNLVELRTSISASKILATPDHPFYTVRGLHSLSTSKCGPGAMCVPYIENGDGLMGRYDVRQLPSGNWHARSQMRGSRGKGRKVLGTFSSESEAKHAIDLYRDIYAPGHYLAWDEAANLEDGDWVVAGWPSQESDVDTIEVPSEYRGTSDFGPARKGPSSYEVTSDFLWVIGLYLAEGSASNRSITFALHQDETNFVDRLKGYFTSQGFNVSVYAIQNSLGIVVAVHSSTLAEWWPEWLGKTCYVKSIPEELLSLPSDKLQYLLEGIYDGDGWKGGLEITQTSEVLALQVSEILHRLGKQPLLRRQISQVPIEPSGNMRATAYCVSWESDDFHHHNRKGRWDFKEEALLSRVSEVERIPYEGPVYNLTVAANHTYVVQGVVVHNCYGTGIVGGYEGPFEIKISPPDSEKRINFDQYGFNLEQVQQVWTGPTPMLSQRDFIVKQNNDRYSIGPVTMFSNRGNVLQQEFTIDVRDENDIIYEVPVTGVAGLTYPETRTMDWDDPQDETNYPQITEDEKVPDSIEERGRTPTYENINHKA